MAITEADIRRASMRMTLALDGDTYHNQFQCVEYPELSRVDAGPKDRRFQGHTKTYYIDGQPVEGSVAAITHAINAFRAVNATGDK